MVVRSLTGVGDFGGSCEADGEWLMLQEKIVEAQSECVLTQDVL